MGRFSSGSTSAESFFPQYLIVAMLLGAVWVTTFRAGADISRGRLGVRMSAFDALHVVGVGPRVYLDITISAMYVGRIVVQVRRGWPVST